MSLSYLFEGSLETSAQTHPGACFLGDSKLVQLTIDDNGHTVQCPDWMLDTVDHIFRATTVILDLCLLELS